MPPFVRPMGLVDDTDIPAADAGEYIAPASNAGYINTSRDPVHATDTSGYHVIGID